MGELLWRGARPVVGFGDAGSDAAQAAAVAAIQTQLGSALSPDQLRTTIAAYTGLSYAQANGLVAIGNSILTGNPPTWDALFPLIAGGLAIAGVGAPVVAVVAAAIPLLTSILSALGLTPSSPKCTWTVGSVCFTGTVPYGPIDPATGQTNTMWQTWQTFMSFAKAQPNMAAQAFPWWHLIDEELPVIDQVLAQYAPPPKVRPVGVKPPAGTFTPAGGGPIPAAPKPPVQPVPQWTVEVNAWMFLRTFYTAWMANAEQALNGHPSATDAQLLTAVVQAWNATHDASSFEVIPAATVPPLKRPPPIVSSPTQLGTSIIDASYPSFVSLLVGGFIDLHAEPPLRVNLGPTKGAAGAPGVTAPSPPAPTGPVVAVAATAGVAAASLATYAAVQGVTWRAALARLFG